MAENCADTDIVKSRLSNRYGEESFFEGITDDGKLLEITADRIDLSWTALKTEAGTDQTCLIASGTGVYPHNDHIDLLGRQQLFSLFTETASDDWRLSITDATGQERTFASGEWGRTLNGSEATSTVEEPKGEPISFVDSNNMFAGGGQRL